MLKRLTDIALASTGLLVASPVIIPAMIAVWLQDYHSPFYVADRVGRGEKLFRMVKLRSMIVNADKSGVDSTSSSDTRITAVGRMIRKFKLDELTQLWNVLCGSMSMVGPRPNVKRETDLYTAEEKMLLTVRPGITDISSIVFSDEGEILKDSEDPDLDYNQLIRPWKSRLGLLYVENQSLALDLELIFLTAVSIVDRNKALRGVQKILTRLDAPLDLKNTATRAFPLEAAPPPGADEIVQTREVA